MSAITFYEPNGAISGILQGDQIVIDANKAATTEAWIDGQWDCKKYYVLEGAAVIRPDNPVQLSAYVLENVPVPATVIINGTSYETNESRVELGFSQPGTYAVKVVAWPYLDKEFTVENPA